MTNIRNDFRRIATAAVGALILSTACVGAAIGPVQASVPQVASAR